jgi:ribulose-5-phosphate 4-epimerase/fuculose-1-phosphate aldolase
MNLSPYSGGIMSSVKNLSDPAVESPSGNQRSAWGMQAPGMVKSRPVRDQVSDEEWQLRVNLAAAYRMMDVYGMTDMIYNHITARVPDAPDQFLINAYGFHYSEVTASNLHKINQEGEFTLRANTHYGINFPGFVIHGAIHLDRPDIHCVIHSHTRAGIAVSAMEGGLLPLSLLSMRFHGHLGYHDCEGVVVNMEERKTLVRDLGPHNAMILRNHGLLACGPSIAEAFNTHYMLEQACKIQVDAMGSGARLVVPPERVVAETARQFEPSVRRAYGVMEWEAMLRLLERRDPSYKD